MATIRRFVDSVGPWRERARVGSLWASILFFQFVRSTRFAASSYDSQNASSYSCTRSILPSTFHHSLNPLSTPSRALHCVSKHAPPTHPPPQARSKPRVPHRRRHSVRSFVRSFVRSSFVVRLRQHPSARSLVRRSLVRRSSFVVCSFVVRPVVHTLLFVDQTRPLRQQPTTNQPTDQQNDYKALTVSE